MLDHSTPIEREVQSREGRWYLRRILPYRTRDNKTEGIVVTFDDVTQLKEAMERMRKAVGNL